jgi:hypothetical protein
VILRALGRLVMVPLGLILGFVAALAVLVSLGLEVTTQTLSRQAGEFDKLEILVDMGFGVLTVAAAASVLPALLIVAVGEIVRIRSVLYYVVGGGAAMALLPALTRLAGPDSAASMPIRVWTVMATAGFAGGLVYWLVAGRRA